MKCGTHGMGHARQQGCEGPCSREGSRCAVNIHMVGVGCAGDRDSGRNKQCPCLKREGSRGRSSSPTVTVASLSTNLESTSYTRGGREESMLGEGEVGRQGT